MKQTAIAEGVRLSSTFKMDGIKSWSLEALATCPGSIDTNGELVPACSGCYATTGNYRYPNVRAPRVHNRTDWKRAEWADDMVAALDNERFFRWFDSGDMYALPLAYKILDVMRRTPWAKHWLPTRMHKFAKFAPVLAEMEALQNVVVRRSSDSITGDTVAGSNTSTIVRDSNDATPAMVVCRAYEREGKCAGCRACWDKSVACVAYVAHGKKIAKQYALIASAA